MLGADASVAGLVRPCHPLTGRKRLAPFPRSSDDPFNIGVVKRVVGSGFNIKGRGGMGIGLPKIKLKVENIEAAAQKFQAAASIGLIKHA